MELVAVVIGTERNRAVPRRHADRAHGLVGEISELIGPTALDRNAPEIELTRDVVDEENVLAVMGERKSGGEAPVSHETLEERRFSRPGRCHRSGHYSSVNRGRNAALDLVLRSRPCPPRGGADLRPHLAVRGSRRTDRG